MSKNPEKLTGKALFDYIRANYSNPVSALSVANKDMQNYYCVGGALSCAIGSQYTFPTTGMLSEMLRKSNPNLGYYSSAGYAGRIIECNDTGNFDAAWSVLERALCQE